MPAYLIAEINVTDPDLYEQYRLRIGPTLRAHGGRYLVRGGETTALEGAWNPERLVVLEFPSVDQARSWWSSPDYAEIKQLREKSSNARIILASGVE